VRPPQNQINDILTTLEDYSLVLRIRPKRVQRHSKCTLQKIKLQIQRNSIKLALKNNPFFKDFLDDD